MSATRAGSASAGCTARGKDLKRERIAVGAESNPGDEAAAILLWPGAVVMHDSSSQKGSRQNLVAVTLRAGSGEKWSKCEILRVSHFTMESAPSSSLSAERNAQPLLSAMNSPDKLSLLWKKMWLRASIAAEPRRHLQRGNNEPIRATHDGDYSRPYYIWN